jgi:3-oxoacyl-[acyl-carrier-protein] synthase II
MGEEQSGVDALRTAQARIASGQADAILVGGSFNAERDDVIMQYALSGALYRGKTPAPVRERCASEDGFVFGSGGAFILLESPDHARARHVKPLASLNTVYVGRARRHASENTVRPDLPDTLHALLNDVQTSNPDLILTNATGIAHLWDAEHNALKNAFPNTPVVATGDLIGHTLEPQSIFGVALAALHIQSSQASRILISSVGHQRGEGVMMVEKV